MKLSFREAVHGIDKEVSIDGKRRSVKVPAGVNDGNRIRFNEFDLLVAVSPDPVFRREGQDLYLEKSLSYPTAVLGGTIEVSTLEGKVTLKVRKGTVSGTLVRLKGEECPIQTVSKNLYIIL
ncbi:MAG: hypothetical protein IPP41_14665 [Rhodocyclaceae bacterium]|nr:hypothetical protein [Rhodocyclaceae bacterium]